MSLGQVWIVGLGLAFSLGLVIAALYLLRYYRKRLLPPIEKRGSGEALAELHQFQAEMRKKLEDGERQDASVVEEPAAPPPELPPPPPPELPPPPPPEPQDEESRKEALAQLQALQAEMRKRLEEDQAREAASGVDMGPSDSGIDDPDPEV